MELKNKKVLVYGMGISGKGAARLLSCEGAIPVLFDKNENTDKKALIEELKLPEAAEIILGRLKESDLDGIDMLALSPGVSINNPDIKLAASKGIEIAGEIELAYGVSKGKIIAITGTNGKTTTTALTGQIMKAAFKDVYVVGNIGSSFAEAAEKTTKESVSVAEISSFQLESIKNFHPAVSAILNITPDHLDRHGSLENYAACKLLIASKQKEDEYCIINYDDEYLRKLAKGLKCKIMYFSGKHALKEGVCLNGENIVYRAENKPEVYICSRQDIRLLGWHNLENVMAACAISMAMDIAAGTVCDVIRNFTAVEHRIEYVCTKCGVTYYNDSKGTNTDAAAKAVASMETPAVLIAGGYDKGADFTEWIKGFNGKVKAMVLIGQTAEKIKETALGLGFTDIYMAKDLKEAVDISGKLAKRGDSVLLSPACASWGQFRNYEERGRMFKDYVRSLSDE